MERAEINEVFTPRRASVNEDMYIRRENLEKHLNRSAKGSMHLFLFGESGSGKSWLFKKTFNEKGINYVIANGANASRNKSLTNEIVSICLGNDAEQRVKRSEKSVEGFQAGLKVSREHQEEYEPIQQDKLVEAFQKLNSKSNGGPSLIVIDNVETINKDQDLLDELANIIILLDDDRYSEFNVKLLIVGVPNEALNYFSSTKNPASVGNRIHELPKIHGLDEGQVKSFVKKGFVDKLKVDLMKEDITKISRYIYYVTLGIPQRVHEYCEYLAYAIEDNSWRYERNHLEFVDEQWLRIGLRESYTVIKSFLRSGESTNGRRNQVIYSLGKLRGHTVSTSSIGQVVREEFPNSVPTSNSGIGQILVQLTKSKFPILKALANSDGYTFCDPRILMCIRTVLKKDAQTNQVFIRKFKIG